MLEKAIQKPFIWPGKALGRSEIPWACPVNELSIENDWYLEKYEILSKAPKGSLVVDVGCKDGSWLGQAKGVLDPGVLRIGIDPIDNGVDKQIGADGNPVYQMYFCCALDNVAVPGSATFNVFDEPGCNSLLNKSSHLARTLVSQRTVPVMSLESVIKGSLQLDSQIYYLKCDCQGKDVEIVKSAGSLADKIEYVQVESSFSKDRPLYEGQPYYEDDIAEMDKLGFSLIYYVLYGNHSPLPEGELLFKRKR